MLHDLVSFLSLTLSPAMAPGAAASAPLVAVVAPTPVAPPVAVVPPSSGSGSGSAAGSGTPAVASSSEADAVVGKVQAFYAGVAQVSATFSQQVENTTFGDTKTSRGKVYIQKPGKMRWDYYAEAGGKKTVKKSFISNGTYLYVVEHDNKQVIKKDLTKDVMPVAVSFLYGKGDLRADFNAELDTSGKHGAGTVLRLTPKKPSAQYKHLFLVVDPTDHHVSASIIVDSAGNTNKINFDASDFATPVKASWFEFDEKSVKSYRIVDGDAAVSDAAAGALVGPGAAASGSGSAAASGSATPK